jgi:uncharacterized membrane protein YbhN (UPF0104 family)
MALALRGIDWERFGVLLRGVAWGWWSLALVLALSVQVVAAIRWAVLARPVGFGLPVTAFVRRFFEGLFFNLFLPTSIGGDVVKAYRLADSTPGRVLAACTVLADRLAGLTAMGVIAVTALVAHRRGLATLPALAVGGALTAAVLATARFVVGNLERILKLMPASRAVEIVAARLLPYQRRPGLVASAIAWGLVVQVGGVLSVACIGRALGVEVGLATWFIVVPLVNLAMLLPISIGGVGVREGMMALLLAPSGVSRETAVAVGMLTLLTAVVCGIVGGLSLLADARSPGPRHRAL